MSARSTLLPRNRTAARGPRADTLLPLPGYTQSLRPGVKASFGLALDTQRLNDVTSDAAAHKVGASFTFDG